MIVKVLGIEAGIKQQMLPKAAMAKKLKCYFNT
jgi:hypothetical protein